MDFSIFSSEQLECINEVTKNLQIIACAGSGKTKTVVARNINIISKGLATPEEIVSITFTNKAAEELKQRIYQEYESEFGNTTGLAEMYVGTIHSFCLNILQECYSKYKKYEIFDEVQRTLFAKKNMSFNSVSSIPYPGGKVPTPFQKFKSSDVKLILSAVDFLREECIDISGLDHEIIDFYNEYIHLLDEHSHFDYAEVQNRFLDELTNSSIISERISKIKYITVDEYQDTNTIQEKIINAIYSINPLINICVVGDDDQTIYEWRGSNHENFIEFPNRYANVERKILSYNYRSSEGIVRLGETVITSNSGHFTKPFNCNKTFEYEPGDIIGQVDYNSIDSENIAIIESIKKLYMSKLVDSSGNEISIDYKDMAILVQSTNKLKEFNESLLELLKANNIPFIVDGTKQLFEQEEIQLIYNLFLYFAENYFKITAPNVNYYDADHETFIKDNNLDVFFDDYYKELKPNYYDNLIQDFYLRLMERSNLFDPSYENSMYNKAVFSRVINDYETIYFSDSFEYRFSGFIKFLYYDAKDIYPEGWLSPKFEDVNALKIMTIHSVKGLEFPVVFMPHLCVDYLFPTKSPGGYQLGGLLSGNLTFAGQIYNSRYRSTDESLTKLFYVAVTRSKKYLVMTKAVQYNKPTGVRVYRKTPEQLQTALMSSFINFSYSFLISKKLEYMSPSTTKNAQLVFDFSTLKDIFECARKFQITSVFGFTSPLNIRMGYGKSLHNIMDDLHSTYLNERRLIDTAILVDEHLHLPLASKTGALYKSMGESAAIIVDEYKKMNKDLFEYVSYVEKPIDYKLNELVFINGRVDLIVNPKSNEISIIDFKSDSETMNHDLRNKQLLIYALGYYKLTGVYPTSVISYDLKNNESHPKSITPSEVDQIENEIIGAYHMIKSKTYLKCTDTSICKDCMYKEICK